MTMDGQVGVPPVADRAHEAVPGASGPLALRRSEVLGIVDRLLGELGRREHRFAWLRDPNGAADAWIPVDAYYPGGRLVVRCMDDEDRLDDLFEELVPAHGLRLLQVVPSELGTDFSAAARALARAIDALGPAPERAHEAPIPRHLSTHEGTVARAFASLAQPEHPPARVGLTQAAAAGRAARLVASRQAAGTPRPRVQPLPARAERSMPPPPRHRQPARAADAAQSDVPRIDPAVGLVMALAVLIEVYVGVAVVGLDGGHVLLAFGFALDACSRALGTVAAERDGEHAWAWLCALFGCLFVASFALWQERGPVTTDPAPLAGLVALAAMVVLAISFTLLAI